MMAGVVQWFETYATWLLALSLVSLLLGVLLAPFFVSRIPQDYFSHPHRQRYSRMASHPLLNTLLVAVKNLVGALLVIAGIVMLFLPGQGLLTLLVGLMIMNYPGKYALECWLIQRPGVLPAINWLRRKSNQLPLRAPDDADGQEGLRNEDRSGKG